MKNRNKTENNESKYINREISWLYFNDRVLQEAMDPATPLLERLKFLGIYSNNRDEFFRVRVATLTRLAEAKSKIEYPLHEDPKETLAQIIAMVSQQELKFTNTYNHIVEQLKFHNVFIINESELTAPQGSFVRKFFKEKIRANLFPIMLHNVKSLTYLKDQTLYLAITLSHASDQESEKFALVKVPTQTCGRFIELPGPEGTTHIILLDDVIRYCLSDIFSILGFDTFRAYALKFTRDAELDLDNDVNKSFLEVMTESVEKRKHGEPVRFVYDKEMPERLLQKLLKKLKIAKEDTKRAGGRYHNFRDFMSFPSIPNPALYFKSFPPLSHPLLPDNKSIIAAIRQRDIMLHYPYHSFSYIIDLLREASIDPAVKEIKMTFYRAAKDSSLINALISASRNGKKVTVFLEIQARFDEEANIYWSNRMQEEGVKIIPIIPGFKVHAKLLLIKRVEGDHLRLYANISTGNFNESTATVYADDSLLTAHQGITKDVDKVFELFESRYIPPQFSHLIVSPFFIRNFLIEMIDQEIEFAKAGKGGRIVIKINNITDEMIVNKLYSASQAGVKIRLIIRGINVLKTELSEISENIQAISIVDRFLEHSRVYLFGNNNDPKVFISSADWMPRNLDHRIEVVCPIYDEHIKSELIKMLDFEWNDNKKARNLRLDKMNNYVESSGLDLRSQFAKYHYFSEVSKLHQ
jgi:polyphosphate kinase